MESGSRLSSDQTLVYPRLPQPRISHVKLMLQKPHQTASPAIQRATVSQPHSRTTRAYLISPFGARDPYCLSRIFSENRFTPFRIML